MLTGQSSITSVFFNLTTSINVLTHHENTTNKTRKKVSKSEAKMPYFCFIFENQD